MVRKTNTELIHELLTKVAALERWATLSWERMDRLEAVQVRMGDAQAAVTARVAVLEERINEVKRVQDETSRQRWLLLIALVGSVLMFVGNLVLLFLRK